MENGAITALNGAGTDPLRQSGAHKRQHSEGLLSRLAFLRPASDTNPPSPTKTPKEPGPEYEPLHHGLHQQHSSESAMAAAMRQQHKARKRKGSLRKAALLSTGRLKLDRRESSEQQEHRELIKGPPSGAATTQHEKRAVPAGASDAEYDASSSSAGTSTTWTLPPPATSHNLTLDTANSALSPTSPTQHDNQLLSPDSITSPISRYASTTSDDDGLHMTIKSAADLTRRRSTLRNPVTTSPARVAASPPPPDSADTEYWGWIILAATWIVFVVGMGSCLGVWSWAWDVGETPYAPPELEDDATLPIVGYYPALIVCTGVMAWVWCLVAWVGMKYFRHARFDAGSGPDDGD